MCLQNRVTPFGDLVAVAARGLFMGNRGGRFHREDRRLGARRWVSRVWICCLIEFRGRHRAIWARSYTELFFLDEVTALAAGHRPCFECRRRDAVRFGTCWADANRRSERPRAAEMDRVLHAERLDGRSKRRHRLAVDALPDGTMFSFGNQSDCAFAVSGERVLQWGPASYAQVRSRPRGIIVDVLTPPSIVAVLAQGYAPKWHHSAFSG